MATHDAASSSNQIGSTPAPLASQASAVPDFPETQVDDDELEQQPAADGDQSDHAHAEAEADGLEASLYSMYRLFDCDWSGRLPLSMSRIWFDMDGRPTLPTS
mmetsp:Transcript_65716/g.137375  ORF Transcript_65716/g.137375 Transcript_65716/m.137375 type:complete len:103 (+) Transcript_65716:266-574(+)